MSIMTFKQFIAENYTSGMATYVKPIGTVRRHKLPNITDDTAFMEDITSSGINVQQYAETTDIFTPTQNEFNNDKVQSIIKNKGFDNPILVSNDDYIVDGHHRWKAAAECGVDITVKKIDMDYSTIIDFLKDKSYVANKKITEDTK